MIKKIEDLNYYELLEVSPQATAQEIHKAYERVRRVYEPNQLVLGATETRLPTMQTPTMTSAVATNGRLKKARHRPRQRAGPPATVRTSHAPDPKIAIERSITTLSGSYFRPFSRKRFTCCTVL